MNTRDWYFRQGVKENELDGAFSDVETAMFRIVKDLGLVGLAAGGKVTPTGVGTCDVDPFFGYDKLGRRAFSTFGLSVNFTNDTLGNPTVPSAGQFRWIALVARHGYLPSDARTDGNGDPISFVHTETISSTGDETPGNAGLLQIISGVSAGSPGAAVRPSIGTDDIVVADLILNDTGVVDGGAAGVNYDRVTRVASFVITTYASANSYSPGNLARWTDGEIYQAVVNTVGVDPSDQTNWKVWRGSAARASWTEETFAYRNAKRQRVSGVDHYGFPAGHIISIDETWLDVNATTKTVTGTGGWFGKWSYRINNGGSTPGAIYGSGPTNAPATLPWGPLCGVNAFGAGVDAASVVELVHPMIYMQGASLVLGAWFSIFDGGGGGVPLSHSSWGFGLGDGTLISTNSVNAMANGTAQPNGAYICRDPNDNPGFWKIVTQSGAGASGTITPVAVAMNQPHFYKVAVLGATASDDSTARVLHFIDGILVANHAISMVNVFLAPFIRASANQGEVGIFEIGRLRAHARLALNDEFDA